MTTNDSAIVMGAQRLDISGSVIPYIQTCNQRIVVGFEVFTAVSTKMAVFWFVAPCSLVEFYQRFRGPCCLHHQGDRPARTSETLVNFYQTTRCYNPEDSHLQSNVNYM
jgi:hypothetical protein